uniref:Uncharacterized protein n=1 Tax=Arundo donax TaxID=35708 RepID=A0A0A9EB95_ARUDO
MSGSAAPHLKPSDSSIDESSWISSRRPPKCNSVTGSRCRRNAAHMLQTNSHAMVCSPNPLENRGIPILCSPKCEAKSRRHSYRHAKPNPIAEFRFDGIELAEC